MSKTEKVITMSRPAASDLLTNDESTYSLVIAVAQRARQIAVELEKEGLPQEEKPVKTAVREFADGKFRMVEAPIGEA